MPMLVTAVVFVGALCILDLLLTFAVLRRLREHTERLGQLSGVGNPSAGVDRAALMGRELPEFTATTVDGAVVSRQSLTGEVELVGIFSPGCAPCHAQAPLFAAEAGALAAGKALALVVGSGADADELVGMLKGVGNVVTGQEGMKVVNGLSINTFPTFLRLDADGAIVDAAVSVRGLSTFSRL
jgi:thiol-disulfide isomerase/thioredoxin